MFRWGFVHPGFASWWWIARTGLWFAFVVLLVACVIWLLGRTGGTRPTPPPRPAEDRALAILRERYARGEITREQYDEMRRTLE
ncbi:MAG TPA: SHOCT domain-containing protein [Thermomicrobiaceae bacterium]|nr:SHOCT domain-containing protein [Thermomicrobiaceae bacterium]